MQSVDSSLDELLPDIEKDVVELIAKHRKLDHNMKHLLKQIGAPDQCSGCHAPILWIRHRYSGASAPYDPDGTPHFATCPKADQFRKRGAHA